jgi:hypothetical protein
MQTNALTMSSISSIHATTQSKSFLSKTLRTSSRKTVSVNTYFHEALTSDNNQKNERKKISSLNLGTNKKRTILGRETRNNSMIQSHAQELAEIAEGWDEETITTVVAAVLGIAAGLGIPIFFVTQEKRDKERIEEIRELNRATLKATGEQMSEEEIKDLRPNRYLDRREFKDDD